MHAGLQQLSAEVLRHLIRYIRNATSRKHKFRLPCQLAQHLLALACWGAGSSPDY